MSAPLVEIEYKGLTCVGRVIVGDWEGDPSIPRGTRQLPPYVEDLQVYGCDDHDIYGMLTEAARDEIIEAIIENSEA